MYGIVRAVRTAPLESILIVARIDKAHIASMALVLTLANYAKSISFLYFALIFLLVNFTNLLL